MAGVVPAIHIFDTLNGCSEGYRTEKLCGWKRLLPARRMSHSSLRRRRVDGRDKPGHDGRGSETQPEPGHSTAIAISVQKKIPIFRTLCYSQAFPEKRGMRHGTDSNTRAAT